MRFEIERNERHVASVTWEGPGQVAVLVDDPADRTRVDRFFGEEVVGAVAHAALAAEQVTRSLVGRTVADVERDLILETLKHCLGNRTHAANILGISIRTLRNKLNEYADGGLPITPAGNGEPRAFVAVG